MPREDLRLGLSLGYRGGAQDTEGLALAVLADDLGYDVVWAAEAYGTDAATILAFVAARTRRIGLGSAVFQIPARTPAMTAMTAASLDSLSGGRFRLGLGVSGPQVSEGWHGVAFADPIGRTREYVAVVRIALDRQPLVHDGVHFQIPLPGKAGKPLRLTVPPVRPRIPIYLAAIGPRNLQLAGEVADGALLVFFAPEHSAHQLAALRAGRARAEASRAKAAAASELGADAPQVPPEPLDLAVTVPLSIGPDPVACADAVRGYAALYLGGMGSRTQNFYNQLAVRMGFGDAARAVQEAYLDGRPRDAAALVPYEFLDQTSLLGPAERVAERLDAYADAGVTTLTAAPVGRPQEQVAALGILALAVGRPPASESPLPRDSS